MKKILSVKRSISLILSAAIVIASAIFTTGLSTTAKALTVPEGTDVWHGTTQVVTPEDDNKTYNVSTAEQLAWALKSNLEIKKINLTADIYLNDLTDFDSWNSTTEGLHNWTSVELPDPATFCRVEIQGNNHTIYGLYDVNTTGNAGLIHNFTDAWTNYLKCYNLGIDYAYISGKYSGAFVATYNVAQNQGERDIVFENCFVGENVIIDCPADSIGAGGFVGYTSRLYNFYENKKISFKNCYSLVNIKNSGNVKEASYGAFCGNTMLKPITMENCYTDKDKIFGFFEPNRDGDGLYVVDPTTNYASVALNSNGNYTTACSVDNMKGIMAAISMSNLGDAYVVTNGYPILKVFSKDLSAIPLGVDSVASKLFGGGRGTEEEPFLISNAQHLRNAIGYFGLGQHYKLTNDIYDNDVNAVKWTDNQGQVNSEKTPKKWFNATDNTDLQKYTGIDGNKGAFYGYIDGAGHAIHGIYTPFQAQNTNNAERYTYIAALIPVMKSGEIKNLTLSDSYLCTFAKNEDGQKKAYAGGIVGHLIGNADFEKVTVDDSVSVKLFSQYCYDHGHGAIIGGIAGSITVNLKDVGASCLFAQRENGKQNFMGLVGRFWGPTINLTNCYSKGVFPVEYNGPSTVNFDNVYTDKADPDGKGDAQTFNGAPNVLDSIVGNAIENPGNAWHNVIGETPMLQVRVNVVADIDGDGSSATQEDLNALKIHLLGVKNKTNTDVNRDQVTDICDLVMLKKICG